MTEDPYAEINKLIDGIAKNLGVSAEVADQIYYLRTRSRWTQALEDRIVKAAKADVFIRTTSGEEEEFLTQAGF